MYEILWHGRGGQGAFTASKLLAAAWAFKNSTNKAIAFPSFGPERRGAPVKAFTKLSSGSIGDRSQITKADVVVYLDDTLYQEGALDELKDNGSIIVCTNNKIDNPRVVSIDALSIAMRVLQRPITNTVVLGALLTLTCEIGIEDLAVAVEKLMPPKLREKNLEAIRTAYDYVRGEYETSV